MTRLYLPATVDHLREWAGAGIIEGDILDEAFEAPDESEEGEYDALMNAADASAALGGAGRRRVVVVVEGPGPAYPIARWAAIHCDSEDRGPDADPDEDLGWFAVAELDQLIAD